MPTKTVVKASLVSDAQKEKISPEKARQIRRAIYNIKSVPVETLCRRGKAKQLKSTGHETLYMYRVGPNTRLIFGVQEGRNTVYEVINIQNDGKRSGIITSLME